MKRAALVFSFLAAMTITAVAEDKPAGWWLPNKDTPATNTAAPPQKTKIIKKTVVIIKRGMTVKHRRHHKRHRRCQIWFLWCWK